MTAYERDGFPRFVRWHFQCVCGGGALKNWFVGTWGTGTATTIVVPGRLGGVFPVSIVSGSEYLCSGSAAGGGCKFWFLSFLSCFVFVYYLCHGGSTACSVPWFGFGLLFLFFMAVFLFFRGDGGVLNYDNSYVYCLMNDQCVLFLVGLEGELMTSRILFFFFFFLFLPLLSVGVNCSSWRKRNTRYECRRASITTTSMLALALALA